jgi:hypothetical protein
MSPLIILSIYTPIIAKYALSSYIIGKGIYKMRKQRRATKP